MVMILDCVDIEISASVCECVCVWVSKFRARRIETATGGATAWRVSRLRVILSPVYVPDRARGLLPIQHPVCNDIQDMEVQVL